MDFYNLFYTFLIYSFLGWVGEVIYAYIKHKKIVNRGFLYGPICPIYGVGAISVVSIVMYFNSIIPSGKTYSLAVLFIYSVIIATAIEYITGSILEKCFQAKWWDYSKEKFNIKGYICLKFSLLWGGLVLFGYTFIYPHLIKVTTNFQSGLGKVLFIPLLMYLSIDFSLTIKSLIDFRTIIIEINKLAEELKYELGTDIEDFRFVFNGNILEIKRILEDKHDQLVRKIEYSSGNIKGNVGRIKTNLTTVKNEIKQKQKDRRIKLLARYEYLSNKLYHNRLYIKFPNIKSRHKIFKKLREVKIKLKKR